MGEDDQRGLHAGKSWRRRALIALAILFALCLIFHRPLLLTLGEHAVKFFAARERLAVDLRLEGNVFTRVVAKNVHIKTTGPNMIESIDAEYVRADYSLWRLIRQGWESCFRDVEIRTARVVLNPENDTIKGPLKPDELFKLFPDRVQITNSAFVLRDKPQNLSIEGIDLLVDPVSAGDLRVDRLQLQGGQAWSNITAETSYKHHDLNLTNMKVGDDRVELLHVDGSKLHDKQLPRLSAELKAIVGAGPVTGSIKMVEKNAVIFHEMEVEGANIDANALNKYLGEPDGTYRGQIENLKLSTVGQIDRPLTWISAFSIQARELQSPIGGFDRCVVTGGSKDGKASLDSAEIFVGAGKLQARGGMTLPAKSDDLLRSPAHLEFSSDTIDLARVSQGMPQHFSGTAQMSGRLDVQDAKLTSSVNVVASNVQTQDGSVEKSSADILVTKVIPPARSEKPWFADLHTELRFESSNILFREYALDTVSGTMRSTDDLVKLEQFFAKRRQNELSVRGDYRVPAEIGKAAGQPASIEVALNAPQMADYWAGDSPNKVTGPLQLDGELAWQNEEGKGHLSLYGSNLRMRNLLFRDVTAQCAMSGKVVYVNDFTAALNNTDYLLAHGSLDIREPFVYEGKVSTNVANLSVFKPILEAAGNKSELQGKLVMDWEGKGEMRTINNEGKLNLTLENGRYANLQKLRANVDAKYSREGLEVPIIFLASDRMDFQAVAQAKGETFEISKIQLDQGKDKYASGYVSIPFVWKNIGSGSTVFPPKGKVIVNFLSENIDIKKVSEDFGIQTAANGILYVNCDAKGTLDQMDARFAIQARDLRSDKAKNLEPANFLITGETKNNVLSIHGKIEQSKIQPVDINASLPFNVAQVLAEHGLRDDTPIKAKVTLPRSSVNFIRQFAPQVEQLDGDLGLDVDVSGTIAQPRFTGAGDITINVARSQNVTLPALRDFKARIVFADDTLRLEQFGGDLSGGKFTLSGGVKFTRLTQANLDLQFKASSALVARNDTVTVRSDADIKIAGPLTSATVTGNVALTNSQFLKNLDLIPIGLPGRPAPQPPAERDELSFPDPPLRDWKFDVTITTKDPFLIRGNLARGGAISNLHLTGTGLHPGLEGQIRLQNVEATLPFSRLEIAYGFLYFDPSDSLNPKMDLHGTSVIRDYTIHVYIFGTTVAPEAVFSSEPPLPQEEIISLLATGATREELTGNNDVLAGRAAMLLVQQLYRKVFRKGEGPQNTSVFDRLDLDVGQIDPRTGQRQATARFKVNDQFVLVGDLDVGGGFRGMVKYLIRFH